MRLFCRVRSGGRDRRDGDGWRGRRTAVARSALIPFAEDHFAGGGLQDGSHRDIDGLPDHLAALSTTTMCVIEIGDALVVLFSFFQDEDRMISPGRTMGLSELASSLMLSTARPATERPC